MELKMIKDLMDAMKEKKIKRLRIRQEKFELELEREVAGVEVVREIPPRPTEKITTKVEVPNLVQASVEEIVGTFVASPMVGTFYGSPSPEDPSFIKVGDKVKEDTVVCIIEAMKVMNEVKAGVSGTVSEVMVENGHPVEFGTKLFKIS